MRGGVVPPAILFAALACALAFVPPGRRWPALTGALFVALVAAQLPLPARWIDGILLGLWISAVATATLVHLPRRLAGAVPLAIGLNAGLWAGATVALTATTWSLVQVMPWLALVVPGAWLAARGRGAAVKVVSSWLIAIAVLGAVLPIVPTPGYAPDHME